jgi:2-succinyl-6-hydroxy-2,4-cyclohexadiene-1-carboxylate synthase
MDKLFIETDFGTIRYLENKGGGDVPTLFIHGFMGVADSWIETISSTGSHSLAVDVVGHGKSSFIDIKGDNTIELWSNSISQLIKSKNLEKVNVCGYSMGGRLSVAFASQYPDSINKLILESSSLGINDDDEREKRLIEDLDRCNQIESNLEKFVDTWESLPMFKNQERRNKLAFIDQRKHRLSHDSLQLSESLKLFSQGAMKSYKDEFSGFDFPIHLINGSEDVKYMDISDKMSTQNKNVTIHSVDSGHNVHLERPNIFIDIIKDILNSN